MDHGRKLSANAREAVGSVRYGVLLDYATEVCLAGIKARLGKKREDFPWVAEELDQGLEEKTVNFAEEKLPKTYALFEMYRDRKEIVIFKTRAEAEK